MKNTILIVDDDECYLDLLRTLLEDDGYYIMTASRGMQALEMMHYSKIDLVLLDLHMPEMNGFDVLDRMCNQTELNYKIPVIMISGIYNHEHVTLALSKGADTFLTKPLSIDLLMTKIRNILN